MLQTQKVVSHCLELPMGESAVGAARAAPQQCPLIHTPSQLLELRGLLTRLLGLPLEASSFLELGIGIGRGRGSG